MKGIGNVTNIENHRKTVPGTDDPMPARRLGMLLAAQLAGGRFGLLASEIDSCVSHLGGRLRVSTTRWILLYLTWQLREELGAKGRKALWFDILTVVGKALYGADGLQLLGGMEVDDIDTWLKRLDRWLRLDEEDVWDGLPPEVYAAGMFLALDHRAPGSQGMHLVDEEFAVAAALIEARARARPWIEEAVRMASQATT